MVVENQEKLSKTHGNPPAALVVSVVSAVSSFSFD